MSLIPVQIGEIHKINIESLGKKKDGIGRIEDYVTIVPSTLIGQTYNVRILKTFKSYCFAEVVK